MGGELKAMRDSARWLVDRASHHGNHTVVDQDHIDGLRDAVNAFDALPSPPSAETIAHRMWSIHPKELDALGLNREQFYAQQLREYAAYKSTPPADAEEVREAVARIVDPIVFRSWVSMIEHCEAIGDGDEDGLRYANATYLKTMEEARAKADQILSLLAAPPSFRDGVEVAAKVMTRNILELARELGMPSSSAESPCQWERRVRLVAIRALAPIRGDVS